MRCYFYFSNKNSDRRVIKNMYFASLLDGLAFGLQHLHHNLLLL